MFKHNILKHTLVAGAAAMALAACSAEEDPAEGESTATVESGNETLASVLGELENSETIREAAKDAGLGSLLDGSGVYTLLAPDDAAFDALGQDGESLMTEEQRPILVALLREHILPGHVTPEAIRDAIESQGGSVDMTTLGGGSITFTQEGDTIVAANTGGKTAQISGAAQAASNGTVIPLDAVLVPAAQD